MALNRQEQQELQSLLAEENRLSGTTIAPDDSDLGRIQTGTKVVNELISERGDETFGEARQGLSDAKGVLNKTIAGLNIAIMPQERVEAAFANSAMALQDGKSFGNAFDEFKEGITGRKLGEIGDVVRRSGFAGSSAGNENTSKAIGLIISFISPISLIKKGTKALKGVSLATDKGLLRAGKQLVKGADDAVVKIGKQVDDAYKPLDKIRVNQSKIIDDLADAPATVVKHVEKEIGTNLEVLAPTIENVRKVKRIIGKLNNKSFGKGVRGVEETILDANVNRIYSKLKKSIIDAIESAGTSKQSRKVLAGQAKALSKADDAFHEVNKASNLIKKSVTDLTLLKPTKGGLVAKKLKSADNVSVRDALNTVRNSGSHAKKNIDKAVDGLNHFNFWQGVEKGTRKAGEAVLFGTAIGTAASGGIKAVQEQF